MALRSMTGFGEGRAESEGLRVVASIRTVNHRFLDLQMRLPDTHRAFELELAATIKKRLHRGRVEARYRIDPLGEPRLSVEVRPAVAESYRRAARELAAGSPDPADGELAVAELLRLPEVVVVQAAADEPVEADGTLLSEATQRALDAVEESRRREGDHLEEVLRSQVGRLGALHGELAAGADEIQRSLAAALGRRLDELVGDRGLDPGRLAQEVAILADRTDVREELDRLSGHLSAFEALLDGGGEVGKRLDFLTQEILRELNTLGSKCRDSGQLELVVEGKTVCERLREQVQNLE